MKKVLIVLSVLRTTNIQQVQVATLPSFVYNKPAVTEAPLNYFWDELDLTYDYYLLTIVSIIMLLVIIILIKMFRRKRSSTEIVVEITNGFSCVLIPIHSLSMCPSYWNVSAPSDVSSISVQGLWNSRITFIWNKFFFENKLNGKVHCVTPSLKISMLQSKLLRRIMKSTYTVSFYIKHDNLLIPLY